MLASVHIADLGLGRALGLIAKGPARIQADGLRNANLGLAAPLGGGLAPKPQLGRVALITMWDDDEALDRFVASSPIAHAFAGGWHTRLRPLRTHGSWPGLPDDLPHSRAVDGDEPVAVLTLGRLRWPRLGPFLRSSAKAGDRAVDAPGLIWATGLARPPFFATCSLWESAAASAGYAYGAGDAHHDAIAAGRAKPFHHQEAFVRFRPYSFGGHLDGRNPLGATSLADAGATPS
ncbi:MAG TPA: spheroidene monooxygenase [Acidimicrobiia bacterium]|nr:spheroidene monooxygenase [Acidimicrobiia bacterium]